MRFREIYDGLFPPYGMKVIAKVRKKQLSPIVNETNPRVNKFLDIGCGNHSVHKFRKIFGSSWNYSGIDISRDNYNERDLEEINDLKIADLEKKSILELFSQEKFDAIYFTQVIEHVNNGYDICKNLRNLQKVDGILYVETPSTISLSLPSRPLTLNFHDDTTHKALYPIERIVSTLEENGYRVIKAGYRKDIRRILVFPLLSLLFILRRETVPGPVLWDIDNFAIFVLACAV